MQFLRYFLVFWGGSSDTSLRVIDENRKTSLSRGSRA
jgi:hypothetical protein